MLDLLITYFNFIAIFFSYLIKKLTFLPPDPPGYKINKNGIQFLIQNNKKIKYGSPNFENVDLVYVDLNKEIEVKSNLLIITPDNSLPICIIYCHGNCGDIGYCVYDCYLLAKKTNCTVVSFEYPNYGPLKSLPLSERNTYKCIQIAYIFANKELNIKSENIILYGFSLGTGVAFDLSCRENFPIGGLILQAPYLSISRILYDFPKSFFFDIFKSCDKAKKLKSKTLFIHGNKDDVVPYIHGRILAKLIPKKYFYDFYTVVDGNHDNIFIKDEENIYKKIKEFIEICCGKQNKEKTKKLSLLTSIKYKSVNVQDNLIDISSLEETKSQYTLNTTIKEDNKSKQQHKSKNKNTIINNMVIRDSLGDTYIIDKNEVANSENTSNMQYNLNDQNNKLIDEGKKEKQFKYNMRKSHSYFKKSIKFINDGIINKSIKK